MKRIRYIDHFIFAVCISILTVNAYTQDSDPCVTGAQTCYFAIEINGVLCGYSVDKYCYGFLNDKKVRYENSDVTLKMKLLGADMDVGIKSMYAIDPVSERAVRIEINIINGKSVVNAVTHISHDTAWFSNSSGVSRAIPVSQDVFFTSQARYPWLVDDFIKKGIKEKKYMCFDPLKGEVTEKVYVWKSEENVTLCDSVFHTLVLEETDNSSGIKTTLWLNRTDGYNVKAFIAGRKIYLADKSVTSRITLADMDKVLFARAGKLIPDVTDLSWLKVRAQINSYGENLTAESLNFPGQKFTGTVKGNYIEGVFEIEPARYDGKNAPAFPPDFSKLTDLKRYLEPEMVIESDDPLIISEAVRITSGSKNSWDAAVKLSRWVAENIAGALPGGVSAINTLKTKEAECAGHSRLLAAFCRAVGIPARLSVGCMYTPYYTGSFGQHAWTEVYMGNAGWVAVDATVFEISYIDAGHIRLGEKASFQPRSMVILDYRTGKGNTGTTGSEKLMPLVGSYMNTEQYRIFKIIKRNDGLAIDIPGGKVLDLDPPDKDGKLFTKLKHEISLSPLNISEGIAHKMIMHQYARLKKVTIPNAAPGETQEESGRLAGNYQFKPAGLSLDVVFSNGIITTQEPSGRSKELIEYTKIDDSWIDKTGNYEIAFITGADNEISELILTMNTEFKRGEPVTNAVEPVIKESGVEAGLRKYDEIKDSGNSNYLFSEHMLHQTGHNLLKENRINDALKVFRKNVKEYPDSFMANDALAETYLKEGEYKLALRYFKAAVKLNPEYKYGQEKIKELTSERRIQVQQ